MAAERGLSIVVTMLIDHGADPLGENGLGVSPLSAAAGAGHVDSALAVLRGLRETSLESIAGPPPSHPTMPNSAGWTPIHFAAAAGHGWMIFKVSDPLIPELCYYSLTHRCLLLTRA